MTMLFSGIIHVTGEPDSGKTTFALECGVVPEKMAFIDDDVKSKDIVRQLEAQGIKFAIYHDLVRETKDMKESAVYQHCLAIIEEIINYKGEIDAVVWDTWSRFQSTLKPFVAKNRNKFKDIWAPSGQIAGAEEWLESQRYEAELLNRLLGKVKLVIITTHLKAYRVGQREVPGKFVPRCSNAVVEKSLMRIWLRRNPNGRPVPIGLVLKRPSKREVTERGIRTVNVLPQRIVPNADEHSLWDAILRYWSEPFGDRQPTPEETPNEYELSILDGTLTPDQKVALQLVLNDSQAELAAVEEIAKTDPNEELLQAIRSFMDSNPGAANTEIMASVPGATMPLIVKAKAKK